MRWWWCSMSREEKVEGPKYKKEEPLVDHDMSLKPQIKPTSY